MDNRRFQCCEQVFAISELVIWKWAAGSVRPARPTGTLYGPSARPRTVSSAARELSRPPWRERGEIGHACPPRHPACVQRRAASLLRVSPEGPMTCGFTVWRAITCSIYTRRALRVSRMAAACFRPGAMLFPLGGHDVSRPVGAARFRRSPAAFPPEPGGVSAGVRRGFRRVPWCSAGRRAPGCRAFPARPSRWARRRSRPPPSSRPCDPFRGRPHDGMIQQYDRPAVSRRRQARPG